MAEPGVKEIREHTEELVAASLGNVVYTLARRQAELAGSLKADDAPAVARAFLREMGFDTPVGGNLSLDTARGVPILRRGPTVS